jgi:hypothetical protein
MLKVEALGTFTRSCFTLGPRVGPNAVMATKRSGNAAVCKTAMSWFDSGRRLRRNMRYLAWLRRYWAGSAARGYPPKSA